MRVVLLLAGLLNFSPAAHAADSLYSRAFGSPANPAVVFLHGGPGYNSVSFELSTAQRLADSGFYVIVFDQRGSGRSSKLRGTYKLDEALDDVHEIYRRYGIKQASLIGHSWGGTLGIFFADRYPTYVDRLVLTGSPLSYPRGFKTMLRKSLHFYSSKDTVQYRMAKALEKADTSALMYASMLFQHAANVGLYTPSIIDSEASQLKTQLRQDTLWRFTRDMAQAPVMGFYRSLGYTTLDMSDHLRRVLEKGVQVRALYGEEDGLFDADHLDDLHRVIGSPIHYIINASHNAFLDKPTAFVYNVVRLLR